MYKHILLPVDDSPASAAAIASCMRFAASIGAQVTALHVQPDSHALSARAPCPNHSDYPPLAAARTAASAHQVRYEPLLRHAAAPHAAILKTAHELRCDLIAMGSHGRIGLHGLVKGSETRKVLLHSTVPVLVFRSEGP
ncbi:MAG: universal stress protein [Burkholderiaceae bacterium]|nr:universal stress protein [Burkholderiaceae bacterium]